ncbi:MAG TPA: hypothetical protein VII69_07820 [Candidatus Eremiobacteraceae bacterium]
MTQPPSSRVYILGLVGIIALAAALPLRAVAAPGLGPVVTTEDGGQIFGFDIDAHGNDGVLSSSQDMPNGDVLSSVETFNQTTGKIVKKVLVRRNQTDFVTVGIFANDVGLVNHELDHGVREYGVMDPVKRNAFTRRWTPPVNPIEVLERADNQETTTSVLYAIELFNQDVPDLIVSDVASNTFSRIIHLDPNTFGLNDGPRIAQDTANNKAVIATSPDGGTVGGSVPLIATINLANGKMKSFNGVVTGLFHSGFVNGLAVDSTTGIACTTTELDADVEFYDLAHGTGHFVSLPNAGGNQAETGAAVVSDSIHHLFLVAQPNSSISSGSTIYVYRENGDLLESINGFSFSNAFSVIAARIALNPSKRIGFVNGPDITQLQGFSY